MIENFTWTVYKGIFFQIDQMILEYHCDCEHKIRDSGYLETGSEINIYI